jgi:thiol:disulfide interchange protein DsbD
MAFGLGGESHVSVRAEFTPGGDGQPARIFVAVNIAPGWHIYSVTQPKGGPIRTAIKLAPSQGCALAGSFQPNVEPTREKSDVFKGITVETHTGKVTWYAPLSLEPRVDPKTLAIEGTITVQPCDAKSCLPPQDLPFTARLGRGIAVAEKDLSTGATPRNAGKTASAAPGEPAERSVFVYLFFGFVGGILLNLMPCVLPVIGLKLLAFVEQSGHDRKTAFLLNVWYSLGLLAVFWLLAALAIALNIGWGALFQQAGFNVFIAVFIFAMALSFLGVWEFPIPGIVGRGRLDRNEGFVGAFAKGVITTILATPCTGPFMGSALAWSLHQPPAHVVAVFTSVGLGMASPYLLIGVFPRLIQFLPKPGAWMETFKQILGFVLLATVVYILTFLKASFVVPTVGLMFVVWMACWWVGKKTAAGSPTLGVWSEMIAVVGVAWILLFLGGDHLLPQGLKDRGWRGFPSLQDIMQDRLGEQKTNVRATFDRLIAMKNPVLVDFTADWCATCKFLEATVLNSEEVQAALSAKGVSVLKADWTHGDPEVTQMLERLGARQVPVIAVYPAGRADQPIVFLDGYTKGQLLDALETVTSPKSHLDKPPRVR